VNNTNEQQGMMANNKAQWQATRHKEQGKAVRHNGEQQVKTTRHK